MRGFEFGGTERFEVRRRIGAGGMGVVYEALDRERGEAVALKTLRDPNAQALYRLKHEFRALAGIVHRNLVGLGELVEHDGVWFFTMELVHGVEFLRWIRSSSGGYDETRLRHGFAQLGSGLQALHQGGKIHRDLKPSNILVGGDGRVVILDFGLITESEGPASTESQAVGTAAYMAPEQAAARRVDPAADWYAVGIMLYEALAGRVPFEGSTIEVLMAKQDHEPVAPSTLAAGVPIDLDTLAVDLLRRDPESRPTGAQVVARLQRRTPAADAPSSPTQTTPFVGRREELERLDIAFARREQNWQTVVLVGESGVGKSALIREFSRRAMAARPDTVVLAGRCYERESVPFKAFDGLVDRLSHHLCGLPDREASTLVPRHAAFLPRIFPVLARVEVIAQAPLAVPVRDSQEVRTRAFDALRELLARLAERRPLVLVIDDLQWVDADSRLLLADLARAPDSPPLLMLLSARASIPAPPGDATELRLGPLDSEDAEALAELLCRRARVHQSAATLAAEARGHPLYIDEMVRHLALAGPSLHQPRLEQVIQARIARLPDAARQILELVSVAAGPLPQQVIGQAARMAAADLDRQVARLRAGNFVRCAGPRPEDVVEPYHDRVREALTGELDGRTAAKHHHRLAVALESSRLAAERPELLLHHLEAAGDSARAAEHAERAGERAAASLAFDQAATFFAAALRLGDPEPEHRRRLRLASARALAAAGRGAEAAHDFLAAAEGGDQATRLVCRQQAAEQLLITGHIESGLAAIEALLAEAGTRLPPTPRRALASLLWHRARLRLRGLRWRPRPTSQQVPEELIRLDVFRALAFGLANVDPIRSADFSSRYLLRALAVGEPGHVGSALAIEAGLVATSGQPARRRAECLLAAVDHAAEVADAGSPVDGAYLRALALDGRGIVAHLTGRFRAAADHLADAEARLVQETVGTTMERNTARLFLCLALRHHGALRRARELSDAYLRDAIRRGDRYMATTLRLNGCFLELAAGRPEQVGIELDSVDWLPPRGRFHMQHWYELETRCDLAVYSDRAGEAIEALASLFSGVDRSLLVRAQIVRAHAAWMRAKLLLADGGRERSPGAVDAMARRIERERVGYARVWALLVRAALASRQPAGRAVGMLRSAVELADAEELILIAAVARHRLGELVGGDEGAALIARARAWMVAEEVADPERLMQVVAPGFGPAV